MNISRTLLWLILIGTVAGLFCVVVSPVFAAQDEEYSPLSLKALPLRYAFVNGDWKKFQAHQWMKQGYVGGVEDFSADLKYPNDVFMEVEGRGLLDQKDYAGAVSIKKGDDVFANFDFKQFPKYYSSNGGVYAPFRTFRDPTLNQELELDIGKIETEVGLLSQEGRPGISFLYEHEYKDGAKSSLAWAGATEGAVSRKISPSWRQIRETVDDFTLKGDYEIAGVTLKADQGLELITSRNKLYQQNFTTNAPTSATFKGQKAIVIQNTELTTTLLTTNVAADKWFYHEKAHAEGAYRFSHLQNRENENLRTFDAGMVPTSFSSNAEQKFNAWSNNSYDSNRVALGFTGFPTTWFMISGRVKGELERYDGFSRYPSDIAPAGVFPATPLISAPNGILDHTEYSDTTHNTKRLGESISLRFKKIPKTAIYSDFELEQISLKLHENRLGVVGADCVQSAVGAACAGPSESFNRETVTWMPRFSWTAGANYVPWNFLNSTLQFRLRTEDNHYNDTSETPNDATHDFSAFFDDLKINTFEVSHRTTYRPFRWFDTSFRYKMRYTDYLARVESLNPRVVTNHTSHIFTYDARLISLKNLFVTGSFNQQFIETKTPADREGRSPALPAFRSDSSTWLISFDYTPKPKITLNTTTSYTRARNFTDFSNVSLPLGSDFDRVGVSAKLRLQVLKDVTVEPGVSVYNYTSNSHVEVGNYTAIVVGTGVVVNWG